MANYDFSTLNSTDLEELVRDLLNAIEKDRKSSIEYRTFKEGKDRGIDFIFSSVGNKYNIVGQVKHYYRSGYKTLLKSLTNVEVSKVKKLNPRKYIFATSVELSLLNKDEILNIFKPYIESTNDIYGKSELNMYLDSYPSILQNHFKLWFSSSNILQKLLNYNIEGRANEFIENQLKKNIRLYVKTSAFTQAKVIIEKYNFLIITGEPGVGKTTLAEILIYEYIKEDYELTYIYDDIKEIEKVLSNDDKKQIFYFDDFLGHNALEIAKAKGSETALMRNITRICQNKSKILILTTRTFILNAAEEESEKLRRFDLRTKYCVLKLSEYSDKVKMQLLKNHIEESEISKELKDVINKRSSFIVSHPNYSPRSVSYITSNDNVTSFSAEEFDNFIINNFNKPDEIWRHAYEQQINDIDRMLLNTFISLGDTVKLVYIEKAFNNRLNYEVNVNNFQRPLNAFNKSFRKLLGGFIIPEYSSDETNETYILVNHSLTDFLDDYLKGNEDEINRIVMSAFYVQQLTKRIFVLGRQKIKIPKNLEKNIIEKRNFFIKEGTKNIDHLTYSLLIYNYTNLNVSSSIIIESFEQISDWNFLSDNYEIASSFIQMIENIEEEKIINYLAEKLFEYISPLMLSIPDIDDVFELIETLQDKYGIAKGSIIKNAANAELTNYLSSLVQQRFDHEMYWILYSSDSSDSPEEKLTEVVKMRDDFRDFGLTIEIDFTNFNSYDWQKESDSYFGEQAENDD